MVNPDDGTWRTVGDHGAEFTAIPQGAIVFNHKQTEALLKYGKVAGRGRALASGTAMISGSGSLWDPSSGGSSSGKSSGSSYSSSDVQKIAEAVSEGAEEGVERGLSKKGAGPTGIDGDDDPYSGDNVELYNSLVSLNEKQGEYAKQFAQEQDMLLKNNAVNEKLINYLLENNFGFTDEELQAIIDAAYERYGDSRNGWKENTISYDKTSSNFFAGVNKDPKTMAGNSYVMRMRDINEDWSTFEDGNIERFGFKLSDSAYAKDTIRAIIEKFFEAISTGSAVNHFKTTDEFKNALANVLYNPDYLLEAIDDRDTRKIRAESRIGFSNLSDAEKEEMYSRWLGKNYNIDNTDLWADTLSAKLDELFSGDWYDSLTTEQYRSYTMSDAISSGVEDLIEIFFDRLERRIDRIDSIISSSFKDVATRSKASYDKIDLLTQELSDKEKAASVYKEAADTINLSEDIKQALREGALKIEDLKGTMGIDQNGSFSTSTTSSGFVTFGQPGKDADAESVFKENVSKYQDYYEKYLDTMDDMADIQESIAEAYMDRFNNIQTDFENQISLLDHESSLYSTALDQMIESGYKGDPEYYNVLKGIEQERYDLLVEQYDTLKSEYDAAMKSGVIEYASEAWYELVTAINETEEAMQGVTGQMVEYTNKARELRFKNIQTEFDNKLSLLDHEVAMYTTILDQVQKSGYTPETEYYDILTGITQERYDLLAKRYDALRNEYDMSMASGSLIYASDAWYELVSAINETEEAMQDINGQMVEYTNKARELVWDAFDNRQKFLDALIDQNDFLMELIDDSNIFDKDGKITQKGVTYAAIGLDSLRKNLKLAKNTGIELDKISKQLLQDPNNEILKEREKELRSRQQQYILSAKKSAQAINDIELKSLRNLIDNYEKVLDKQKDVRSYERTLRDKTDDISDIRKQIEAYANDTSEDARRKVQELQKKLKDSEEDLQDTQYDHYIDMQKEMFDELYSEYEDAMNRRFDDVGQMISDVSKGLETKADDISNTLHTIAEGVGYLIQYELDKNSFGDIDLDGLITPEDARLALRAGVGLEKLTDQQIANGDVDGDGKVGFGDARAILRIATKIDTVEQYLRALGIVGYSGGGLVNKTGLAMLHGTKTDPEVVLNANDSKNLMGLRDIMREMTRMDSIAPGIISKVGTGTNNVTPSIGEIQINIPIDKVEDYNDFINKMKADNRFSKLVQAASVDLLTGGSAMKRYQI